MKYYGILYTPYKEIYLKRNAAKELFIILRRYARYLGQPYIIVIRRCDHVGILIYKMIDDILEISHLPQNYTREV